MNDSLPAEVHSSEEIDDLLTTFERNGIEIYEDAASAKAARAVEVSVERSDRDGAVKEDAHAEEGVSGSDLDLTPGSLEKTNDPVRMYLREMGTVPLLTRGRSPRQGIERVIGGDEGHHPFADRYRERSRWATTWQGCSFYQGNCPVRR